MRMATEGGRAFPGIEYGYVGRFFDLLRESGYEPEGINVSQDMVCQASSDTQSNCLVGFLDWESESSIRITAG